MSGFNADICDAIYTPTELNREVRVHLEAGFSRISLEGEISNLAKPASGHLYFSIKDDAAQVRCAMFRNAAMRINIKPANGMQVLARGRISLYEPRGEYQFIVESLQEAGIGLLQQGELCWLQILSSLMPKTDHLPDCCSGFNPNRGWSALFRHARENRPSCYASGPRY